jgi:hypothetical protein
LHWQKKQHILASLRKAEQNIFVPSGLARGFLKSFPKCSSNEVFIGAILKPLGRNDYKAISTHFDATPSSKFSAKFVYSFVTD